ncbi:MAG: DUF4197 domain-containing protein [Bacteroidales bacterium]
MRPAVILFSILSFFLTSINGCEEIARPPLSEAEVSRGLKEALRVGVEKSVAQASANNGFLEHPVLRIGFPPQAQGAYDYMMSSSLLRPLLDEFVVRMNRAAENASEKAQPIFVDAITRMTIQDAWDILRGSDDAATTYLHRSTYSSLYEAFRPDIQQSLDAVGAAAAWQELSKVYNGIAAFNQNLQPVNADLADYTTNQALEGLFYLIEQEEQKIREDPAARVTDLLRKVFARQ